MGKKGASNFCQRTCIDDYSDWCIGACIDPPIECQVTKTHIPSDHLPLIDAATYIPKEYSDPILDVFRANGIPTSSKF